MATQHTRSPYKGDKQALVIAIDVGTTFSGASYSVLTPNEVPDIVDVTGFKGQEDKSSSTKVPSILFYDSNGRLLACGSEADDTIITEEEYIKVEWFKLLLRPLSLGISLANAPDARLPPGKTVVDVFGDFFRYMRSCVQDYFIESDGVTLWDKLGEDAHYVLTHPNGWEGFQQVQMRTAAILGGLIPDDPSAHHRIQFVTEGEASFHWCVDIGLAKSVLKANAHVIVADAGGGTIDVSSFRVSSLQPLKLQETAAAECRVVGSIFVTQAFKEQIEDKLNTSTYGTEEYIERATEEFDKKTKCLFKDRSNAALIRIGARRDTDIRHDIKMGQLTLTGDFIAASFEQSCIGAAEAIRAQLTKKQKTQATVYLVGGFAASRWLYSEIQRRLANDNVDIKRADSHTSKAVAHGAVAFYLDNYIVSRIAKHTYGTALRWSYDPSSASHRQRDHLTTMCTVTGQRKLEGGFYAIVKKGETIKSDAVYRSSLLIPTPVRQAVECVVVLQRYMGTRKNIEFFDEDPRSFFQPLCTFRATIPVAALESQFGLLGQYWVAPFEVVMNLGTSELTCHVEWKEKGQIKRGIAASVWEDI